jgi:hypothetical protein
MHGMLEFDVPPETLHVRHFVERSHGNIAKRLRAVEIDDDDPGDELDALPVTDVSGIVPHPRLFGISDREAGVGEEIYPDDFLVSIHLRNASARFGKGEWNANDRAHERAMIQYEKAKKAEQARRREELEARGAAGDGEAGAAGDA